MFLRVLKMHLKRLKNSLKRCIMCLITYTYGTYLIFILNLKALNFAFKNSIAVSVSVDPGLFS